MKNTTVWTNINADQTVGIRCIFLWQILNKQNWPLESLDNSTLTGVYRYIYLHSKIFVIKVAVWESILMLLEQYVFNGIYLMQILLIKSERLNAKLNDAQTGLNWNNYVWKNISKLNTVYI